jgi:hypothetical protein
MDPNDLRECVQQAIKNEIADPVAWQRCATIEKVERESLRAVLDSWNSAS